MEHTRTDSAIRAAVDATGPPPERPLFLGPAGGPVPPARHSVRGQVLRALRAALATGDLEPGRVYSAPVLAERYGVSATPVREAMQQLASEGAVEPVPNRGFRVSALAARDLAELAAIRADLEAPALLRLARTVPPGRWAALRPQAQATVAAARRDDRPGFAEADLAFHRALLGIGGNRQLTSVVTELHRRAQCPTAAPLDPEPDTAAREHLDLLDALTRQDLRTAERLIRGHFRTRH